MCVCVCVCVCLCVFYDTINEHVRFVLEKKLDMSHISFSGIALL